MSLDDFITTVFCLIDDFLIDLLDGQRLRQRGPRPTVPDSVVLTCEIVGEFLSYDTDSGIFRYFRRHHAALFPELLAVCRTTFTRQAANLWKIKEHLHTYLHRHIDGDRRVTITDSFPVPVCRFARAPRCQRLAAEAAYGYDELARQTFYGLRAHVAVFWPGVICSAELAPADVSDVAMAPEVLGQVQGWALADRNYWSPNLTDELRREGVALVAPFKQKKHERRPFPPNLTRMRRRIETVIGQLVGRFNAKKVWAMDRWHAVSRWLRKIASHAMAMLLCRREGLPPLRFAELIND